MKTQRDRRPEWQKELEALLDNKACKAEIVQKVWQLMKKEREEGFRSGVHVAGGSIREDMGR